MSDARLYLVAYDITAPRRWRRVYKVLCRVGERGQFSVFLCRLPPARMRQVGAVLAGLIDPQSDRLMVLDLGPAATAPARILVGAGLVPPGQAWPLVI
jgi:CRISPR-associated protein Cas2